ncbi:hypothetical protein BU23DRAFT_95997 [Bimuria novae-zelandiae CBS 107.79]|uniref:Uncharacterized protein n=1 Tax=Bimuria novae-zelandiae CBS 107.79 TaxID=1447943 RepID=A0A6A5VAW4_9PLEO|nr:hypothetical protein BU23DRAFT_95997 [Bimuria novae-zelandiae CBS 107.79]
MKIGVVTTRTDYGDREWLYSEKLGALLDRCLSLDLAERPSAGELAELLTDAEGGGVDLLAGSLSLEL